MTERRVRAALKTCAASGSWEVALALLDRAECKDGSDSLGWVPDSTMYRVVFESCLTAGQPQRALAVLERMERVGFTVSQVGDVTLTIY